MTAVAALIVVVGFVGIVFPALPGLPLVWVGVLVWALGVRTTAAWVCVGVCAVVAVAGMVLQYVLPGRRLAAQGVPRSTLLIGAVVGVVGFFVVPVVGLILGFVLGVYLAELSRQGSSALAWPSTRRALAAVGWSMLIEFAAAGAVTTIWLLTAVLS